MLGFEVKEEAVKGAEEIDIVYSGLEEIMYHACHDMWGYAHKHNLIFRDACLVRAIQKVYQSYKECGITV